MPKSSAQNEPDVWVIGAGAAGIFAALAAAKAGAKVRLVEKTNRIGTKILISGGGKCNIAHEGPIEDVLRAFRPNEARFLRRSVYQLPNRTIIDLFVQRGLEVYTRPDGRVFPVHQTAKDVVAILKDLLDEHGVELCLLSPVLKLKFSDGAISGLEIGEPPRKASTKAQFENRRRFGAKALLSEVVQTIEDAREAALKPGFYPAKHVVLCVGGSSYPNSGTTGDGWPWAKEAGHRLIKIRAALAPIYIATDEIPLSSGVALRNITLRAKSGAKEVARWTGDLLFTHQGVSGPTVLGISRAVAEAVESGTVQLSVDLWPNLSDEELSEEWIQRGTKHPRQRIDALLQAQMPEAAVTTLLHDVGVAPDTMLGQLAKKDRNRLIQRLKQWPLGTVRTVVLEKGECVAGGIALDEIDPKTMRSLKCKGLYPCGEILDISGPVGGYNLQAAFATGHVAGLTAAQDALSSDP